MRVGVLLGSVEQYEGMPYIFVDGAMEMEDVELDGEKVMIPESSWKKVYAQMEHSFPKRTIQGWFLCGGPGSPLSPLNYWKQQSQHFGQTSHFLISFQIIKTANPGETPTFTAKGQKTEPE